MMKSFISITGIVLSSVLLVSAQQNCYFGPGAGFRGPSNLVPCNTTGISACCLLGDTCISGNACYNYATGNTYQYGCTDINYEDATCPRKCGWDPAKSPWIGLEYCNDVQDLDNTWTCLAPESCGCKWKSSYDLQILPSRGCAAMGSEARIALYAPSTLLAYVSLPSTIGGSTGYYSTTTGTDGGLSVISTAIAGYTPDSFTQYTTYRDIPTTVAYINPAATASPATNPPAFIYTDTTPYAPPAAPSTSSPPTSSTSLTTSSSTTRSATPTAPPASSGLSTGAKAGIGVGVAGGFCLLAALGVCWFLVARRRKDRNAETQHAPPQYFGSPPPIGGPYMQGQQPSGWAPFPPGTPYYVVPATKDSAVANISPPYSPPHSPPPPTELSSDQRHETLGEGSPSPLPPRAGSPRGVSTPTYEYGSPRFRESI